MRFSAFKCEKMKNELAETIRIYHQRGWSPATSTNYSFRENDRIWVSRSGVDKSNFQASDFIQVDEFGNVLEPYQSCKPSDETKIHLCIYQLFPDAQVILHSHSKYPVLVSMKFQDFLIVENYELQKGFSGVVTHACQLQIPILDNAQEMNFFEKNMKARNNELKYHCFIIRQHGTYAWGKNLFEAKRHLESLDYLCECELEKLTWQS